MTTEFRKEPRQWKNTQGLPLPRLELFWEKETEDAPNWSARMCFYGLVLPLRSTDIRQDEEKTGATFIPMGATSVKGGEGSTRPVNSPYYGYPVRPAKDRNTVVDTPFRDSAHASWDATVLKLPVWVVCEDNFCTLEEAHED